MINPATLFDDVQLAMPADEEAAIVGVIEIDQPLQYSAVAWSTRSKYNP
jgi:hypothetical protein